MVHSGIFRMKVLNCLINGNHWRYSFQCWLNGLRKSKGASIWKWHGRSASLPLLTPRLASSGTQELTSPRKELKMQFACHIDMLLIWFNLPSSLALVNERKGCWNSSQKNLGSEWFHYLLAVAVLKTFIFFSFFFCNSKNSVTATWTRGCKQSWFQHVLIEHLLCAGSERLTEPGTYGIYMSGETEVREIIMEILTFTQGYICEGAWEVLVPFPFSYLVLKKVEEWDEITRALKITWPNTLSYFFYWLHLNLWVKGWSWYMTAMMIITTVKSFFLS